MDEKARSVFDDLMFTLSYEISSNSEIFIIE